MYSSEHIDASIPKIDRTNMRFATFRNGDRVDLQAQGTFHSDNPDLKDPENMAKIVYEAIRLGARHLDCATAYENEEAVGEGIAMAIRDGLCTRKELFITTKLWNRDMRPDQVEIACNLSIANLQCDYIDLYLNHWPVPNDHPPGCDGNALNPDAVPYIHEYFMSVWWKIVDLKKAGKVKHIGVSNHTRGQLKLLFRDTDEESRPEVNQIELHPLHQQTEDVEWMIGQGLIVFGYMALGSERRPGRDIFEEHQSDIKHPVIVAIAKELKLTVQQVCLAWAAQRLGGEVGSVSMAERSQWIKDNLEVGTTKLLSDEHMDAISGTEDKAGINCNNRLIWGQVFFWPFATLYGHERDVLWNDSQLFETYGEYVEFAKATYDMCVKRKALTTKTPENVSNYIRWFLAQDWSKAA